MNNQTLFLGRGSLKGKMMLMKTVKWQSHAFALWFLFSVSRLSVDRKTVLVDTLRAALLNSTPLGRPSHCDVNHGDSCPFYSCALGNLLAVFHLLLAPSAGPAAMRPTCRQLLSRMPVALVTHIAGLPRQIRHSEKGRRS